MTWEEFVPGCCLARITYDLFDWDDVPSPAAMIDNVGGAVSLEWEGLPPTRITWSHTPWWEAQGLELGGVVNELTRTVDVCFRWPSLIGARLERIGLSRTLSPTPQVWAMNLRFSQDCSLIVALGEVTNLVPTFSADNLVVMGCENIARAYWPSNEDGHVTESSAWGD
jgi:hypothetical protein